LSKPSTANFEGKISGHIIAITKDEDYFQNPDKQAPLDRQVHYLTGQAKVRDLEKHIDPVRCLLSNGVDRMVYKLCDFTPEEIAIIEGRM